MRRLVLLVLLGTAACKQGIGDVCQVDSDCESGLTCTKVAGQTLNHCGRGTGPGSGDNFDANPMADAEIPDGLPAIDAGPPDAGPWSLRVDVDLDGDVDDDCDCDVGRVVDVFVGVTDPEPAAGAWNPVRGTWPEDLSDLERALNPPEPVRATLKAGRNDPCPCGSGVKTKKCCPELAAWRRARRA